MKPIKNIRRISLCVIMVFILFSMSVSATLAGTLSAAFRSVLCAIAGAIWKLATIVAVLVIIAAAAMWVYSRDDAGARNQARVWIVNALIGLIVILIAKSVVTGVTINSSFVGWCW
jgi:type IV secretory pathway VirB2 component (pilin)